MGKVEVALPRETKAEAMHRLQREGRWEQASAYRQEVRQQQRAQGHTKAEARDAAWAAMLKEFPPLEADGEASKHVEPSGPMELVESVGLSAEELDQLRGRTRGREVDWVRSVVWAFEALGQETVLPSDAPTPGTWALYGWAKQSANKFYETVLPRALAAQEKRRQTTDDEFVQTELLPLEELAATLKAFWEECRESGMNEFGFPEEV
jgi:hypothetical protein